MKTEGSRKAIEIPLSKYSKFQFKKIVAVGKGITCIDANLPNEYLSAEIAYVSRNKLDSLDGIQQLKNLKSFSAADNCLTHLSAVAQLQHCTQLESVNLADGNALSDVPNYRQRLICLLPPALKVLDGLPVTSQERLAAQVACFLEKHILEAAVSNACYVHKLGRVAQLECLHQELHCRLSPGCAVKKETNWRRSQYAASRACRVASMWDYERNIGENERQMIEEAILKEATASAQRRRQKLPGVGKTWINSLCGILEAQEESIRALIGILLGGSDDFCKEIGREGLAEIERAVSGFSLLSSSDAPAPEQAAALRHMLRAGHIRLLEELREYGEDDWAITTVTHENGECSNDESEIIINGDAICTDCNSLKATLDAAEETIQNLKSDVKCAVQESKRAVEEATLLHRNERVAMQEALASLQKWLEQANASKDMERARAQTAEYYLQESREEVADLSSKLASAQENWLAAEYGAASAAALEHALCEALQRSASLKAEEDLCSDKQPISLSISISFDEELEAERELSAKLAQQLAESREVLLGHEVDQKVMHSRVRMRERRFARRVLQRWREAAKRERIEKIIEARQRAKNASNLLQTWKIATVRSETIDCMVRRQNATAQQCALLAWRSAVRATAMERSLECIATRHFRLLLQRRVLKSLGLHVDSYRQVEMMSSDAATALQQAAARRRKDALSVAFSSWRDFASQGAVVRRASCLLSTAHRQSYLQRTMFRAWQCGAASERAGRCGKAVRAVVLCQRALCAWQQYRHSTALLSTAEFQVRLRVRQRVLSTALTALGSWSRALQSIKKAQQDRQLARGLAGWRLGAMVSQAERQAHAKAAVIEKDILQCSLYIWKDAASTQRRSRDRGARAQEGLARWTMQKTLRTWRLNSAHQQLANLSWKTESLSRAAEEACDVIQSKSLEIERLTSHKDNALALAEDYKQELDRVREELRAAHDAKTVAQARLALVFKEHSDTQQSYDASLMVLNEKLNAEYVARQDAQRVANCAVAEKDAAQAAVREALSETLAAEERCRTIETQLTVAREENAAAHLEVEQWIERERAARCACQQASQVCLELEAAVAASDDRAAQAVARLHRALAENERLLSARRTLQSEVRELQGRLTEAQRERRAAVDARVTANIETAGALRQATRSRVDV